MRRIAVIAGTTVDTRMGVQFLESRFAGNSPDAPKAEIIYLPVAEDCDTQFKFQYSDMDGKRAVMDGLFDPEIKRGTEDFFIYCNSLSGAFDFDSYALRKSMETDANVKVYTPLQVYRRLAKNYRRVGLMAANNLSAHAIEETMMSQNQDIYVIGTGNMPIVRAIEDGMTPREIVDSCGLASMLNYMKCCGAEAVILGCTHFPYIKDELEKLSELPLIDPADEMFDALLRSSGEV